MTNSPELKIDDKCSEKLQRIESEISKAKKDLENFKNANNPELQSQIEELETKLKELEKEKQKIISETQSCLNLEKVWKTEIAQVNANLNNTNLSWEEKQEIRKVLEEKWNWELDFSKIEWWIIGIILAIIKTLVWWFTSVWNYEYSEADSSETPWRSIKWKEKTPKDKENFIVEYKDIAKQMEKEFKIPWEFIISQAWLESAWWTSGLAVNYNNLFGIKARKWWKSVLLWTNEEINGQMVRKKEPFRVYDSIEESFRDHARFLIENPRYKNAFKYSSDPINFAIEIARAWYATDSGYAWKLTSTMKWIA